MDLRLKTRGSERERSNVISIILLKCNCSLYLLVVN